MRESAFWAGMNNPVKGLIARQEGAFEVRGYHFAFQARCLA
jgi:hypothetical protein